MNNENEKIIEILNLLKNKPNMTNFGRHVKTKYMNLFEYIMSLDYPLDASFNERVYYLGEKIAQKEKIQASQKKIYCLVQIIRKNKVNWNLNYFAK